MAICSEQQPPAFSAGDGHTGACWLLDPSGQHGGEHAGRSVKPADVTAPAATDAASPAT
jgi:hypothetical protein